MKAKKVGDGLEKILLSQNDG